MKQFWFITSFLLLAIGFSFAQKESPSNGGSNVLQNPSSGKSNPEKINSIIEVHSKTINNPELPKPNLHSKIITHKGYTLSFNVTYHIADWVAYELTTEETIPLVKRTNHFIPDPLLTCCPISNADYYNSGYDRGHLAPSADMCYSFQTMEESFYLSNMSPQNPSFNRGIWKRLEEQVRQWAIDDKAVYIVTGTVLTKGLSTIGYNGITVPSYFYKVILDNTESDVKGIGFIIPNQGSQEPLQHFAVTIDSVEKVTGIDFYYQLPKDKQRDFESKVDLNRWSWTISKTHSTEGERTPTVQCKGLEQNGDRCVRMTANSNGYCSMHQSKAGVGQENSKAQKSTTKRNVSVRCSAITKKGNQCSRMTNSPNGKCWQHGGD